MVDHKILEPMSFHAQDTTVKLHSVAKTRTLVSKRGTINKSNSVAKTRTLIKKRRTTRVTPSVQYRTDFVKRQSIVTHINKQQRGKHKDSGNQQHSPREKLG